MFLKNINAQIPVINARRVLESVTNKKGTNLLIFVPNQAQVITLIDDITTETTVSIPHNLVLLKHFLGYKRKYEEIKYKTANQET